MKKRTKEVHNLAVQAYEKLEPELQKVAEQLQDPMEMSYFFSVLANKVLEHRMNTVLATEKAPHPSVVWNQETAMHMLGDTDGYHGQTWGTSTLRKIAIDCLKGEKCPDLSCGTPEEEKAFKKAWNKIQGKKD